MEIQASRTRARIGPAGEPILLLDQDRARWDRLLIAAASPRSSARGSCGGAPGPLRPAGRDRRLPRAGPAADGHRLGAHRRALRRARRSSLPSPVVELNRAVAVGDGLRSRGRARARRRARSRARACRATTCCRACAATSSRSSAAPTRRAPSSTAPPRSRATPASAHCCLSGWQPALPGTPSYRRDDIAGACPADASSPLLANTGTRRHTARSDPTPARAYAPRALTAASAGPDPRARTHSP